MPHCENDRSTRVGREQEEERRQKKALNHRVWWHNRYYILIASLGYRVLTAGSGPEALEILRQDTPIDLLFTDIFMPGGLHGPQLVNAARRLRPGLKFLYTSGFFEYAEIRDALDPSIAQVAAQETVEARGITTEIKIEEVIFGHLTELNDKFKLRASEFIFAPGGYLGAHHHVGPGIRYILSGELTFTEGGQETVYKAGEYYFETGNLAHTAQNKTTAPLRVLVVEILPKNWTAPTLIAPKSQ
jgi:quercetin dioxygenase-like cupin family protein